MSGESEIVVNDHVRIPLNEITFRFSGSSGPGGQHVNKTATKVTLHFDVNLSPSLTEAQRARVMQKLAARIDKTGVLQIQEQASRSQRRNRKTAVARLRLMLAEALREPKKRRRTRPGRAAN